MNPLEEIMEVLRDFPDVVSIIDTVSSFTVVPIEKDRLGIDVILTGSQKALALPPGMSLLSVSKKALDRAANVPDRGYYFDFHEFQKNHEKGMTPSTPVISHIYALKQQLATINTEGLENRYARHLHLNNLVRDWVKNKGLSLFPEAGYESVSLCCVSNADDTLDIPAMNKYLRNNCNAQMDQGYGKIKAKTFRINNMGNETEASIKEYLGLLDRTIEAT